jgi:hypothetical protein
MLPFAGTIFISAFLLFQVQPLISRVILPWYGGTPSVWTTCMLFFQAVLLAGYCYAHLVQSLAARKQAIVHGVLLAAGLAMCWIMPSDKWKPTTVDDPIPSILMLLAANVGVPYLIASTTGPLLQAWFARLYPGTSPYRLYALSNVGSLLALVTYPAYFERFWTLRDQTTFWSIGFVVFVLFCGYCAWRVYQSTTAEGERQTLERLFTEQDSGKGKGAMPPPNRAYVPPELPSVGDHLLWVMLAACGSTVFLATTNQMCEDIAVVPFLYVLPLGLYLLSFILTFDSNRWYVRPLWGMLLIATAIGSVKIHEMKSDANIASQVVVYSSFVFCACMVCHGELSRLKPIPEYLTAFFLLVSCGGMLGGLFVGVVAPNRFDGYWEFPIALVFVFISFAAAMIRNSEGVSRTHWLGLAVVCVVGFKMYQEAREFITGADEKDPDKETLFRGRNFFGALEVYRTTREVPSTRRERPVNKLIHGRIEHGFQWRDESRRRLKTTYYGEKSGIGLAINHHPRTEAAGSGERKLRMAMVGLGTGTTATYAGKGDVLRFYDINPMVDRISNRYFTYRKDAIKAGAQVDVLLGDARIVMERQIDEGEKQDFDVIGLDAFSSDAIPAHLLTLECAKIYLQHMRDKDAILAIHVSNRYLVLERICRALAEKLEMTPIKVENESVGENGVYESSWVLLAHKSNKKFLDHPEVKAHRKMWLKKERRLDRVWTDDYYNLFDVVDWSLSRRDAVDLNKDVKKYFRDTLDDVGSKFRWFTGRPEPHEYDRKLANEAYDYAVEDADIAFRRAREDTGMNDWDDVQEGFDKEDVDFAIEQEKKYNKERPKEREEEDKKRAEDRKKRHELLLELKKQEDEKRARGETEDEDSEADDDS